MLTAEIDRLALATHSLRPDWPANALRTFITNQLAGYAWQDAAVALTFVACDPTTKTPARVLEQGPWWHATAATVEHPRQPPRFATDTTPDQTRNPAIRAQLRQMLKEQQ